MQDEEAEEEKAQVEEECEEEGKTENDDLYDEPAAPTASTPQASSHREGTSRVRDPLDILEDLYGELEAKYEEMTAAVSRYQDVWRRVQEARDSAASTAQLQGVKGGIEDNSRVSDGDLDYDSLWLEDELQGDEDSGAESDGDNLFQP